MTLGATFATLRHGLLHGQKHPIFSCQHTHIILLGDIPYPIGRYGVPDRKRAFSSEGLHVNKRSHYLCPENQRVMGRHDTYFWDCKTPYSKPAEKLLKATQHCLT